MFYRFIRSLLFFEKRCDVFRPPPTPHEKKTYLKRFWFATSITRLFFFILQVKTEFPLPERDDDCFDVSNIENSSLDEFKFQ